MAGLGCRWSEQYHHLFDRNANCGIRIRSWQSFLHRTLCKQSVELATESHTFPPAILFVAKRRTPALIRSRVVFCIENARLDALVSLTAASDSGKHPRHTRAVNAATISRTVSVPQERSPQNGSSCRGCDSACSGTKLNNKSRHGAQRAAQDGKFDALGRV